MTNSIDWRARYERARKLLTIDDCVHNGTVYPRWIGAGDHFWYERTGVAGAEYRIVDAATGNGRVAFTRAQVATALARRFGRDIDPHQLMLRNLAIDEARECALFEAFGKDWEYRFAEAALGEVDKQVDRNWLISPDGRLAAFTRDFNLWVRELASGAERALTSDGTSAFAYAEPPGATRYQKDAVGGRPEAAWSPDSARLLTIRTDEREITDLPYVDYAPRDGIRPRVHDNPTSLPGDPSVTEFRVLAIDVATGQQVAARYSPLVGIRMNDTIFSAGLAWWNADGQRAYFVDVERHEKAAHVVAFDTRTGAANTLFSERSDTYVDLSINVYTAALVFPLAVSDELIWYSERSGNGHLYLYELSSGRLKRQLTDGEWRVRDVQHVDAERREILLTASGIATGEDPYICKPCLVSLDRDELQILSDGPGDHILWRPGEYSLIFAGFLGHNMHTVAAVAPSGNYFVETVGRPDGLPTTVLRGRDGRLVTELEVATAVGLPRDWAWPQAVALKADDGVTDIYGLLFPPPDFDAAQSYPLIDYIYGGPQVSHVPKSAFAGAGVADEYATAAALASLGLFVLILDGRGTSHRERAFHKTSYGAVETASDINDHVAAIRQLADEHGSIDLDRIGITGFSGGGYMAAMAALRRGDVFKVAVAGGGNYDQALFWHTWGERYHGPFEPGLYARQAVKTYADGLTGKLMLIHGLLDAGCHPAALFQFVQALIDADKDVDLVVLPRVAHEITGYGERRRLDYFVTHLFGDVPPKGISFSTKRDHINALVAANVEPPEADPSEG